MNPFTIPGGSSAPNNPFTKKQPLGDVNQQKQPPRTFPVKPKLGKSHTTEIARDKTEQRSIVPSSQDKLVEMFRNKHGKPELLELQTEGQLIQSLESIHNILTAGENSIVYRLNTIENVVLTLNKNIEELPYKLKNMKDAQQPETQIQDLHEKCNKFITEDDLRKMLASYFNQLKIEVADMIDERLNISS